MVAEGGYADVSSMDAVIRDLESRYDRLQGLRQHPGTDVAKEKLLAQIGMVDPVDAAASRDERRRLKKRLLRELDGEKDHLRKTLDVVEAARRAAPRPAGPAGPRAWRPASASASLGRSAPPAATPKPRGSAVTAARAKRALPKGEDEDAAMLALHRGDGSVGSGAHFLLSNGDVDCLGRCRRR